VLFDERDKAWNRLRTLCVLFSEVMHALDGYMPEGMRISFLGVEPLEKELRHFDGEKLVPYNWDRDLVATWESALSELQHNADARLPVKLKHPTPKLGAPFAVPWCVETLAVLAARERGSDGECRATNKPVSWWHHLLFRCATGTPALMHGWARPGAAFQKTCKKSVIFQPFSSLRPYGLRLTITNYR